LFYVKISRKHVNPLADVALNCTENEKKKKKSGNEKGQFTQK